MKAAEQRWVTLGGATWADLIGHIASLPLRTPKQIEHAARKMRFAETLRPLMQANPRMTIREWRDFVLAKAHDNAEPGA
ncbi:MAG: hypothetical protein ABI601_21365 [bacterium]